MLTLKSKFSEFIELCRKAGACADAGEAIPVMEYANKGNGMKADGTCADGFKLFLEDKSMPEGWAIWVLTNVGKDLDEKCRKFFIDKITDVRVAIQLHLDCEYLTDEEDKLLESKFIVGEKNVFPTIEKELSTGIVTRAKVVVK